MKPSEILREAKALIDAPEKWCKNHHAVDEKGQEVPTESLAACSRCAVGAIDAVGERCRAPWWHEGLVLARNKLRESIPSESVLAGTAYIPDYNDAETTTHANVMAWFDRAIAKAEEGERA